MSCDENAFPRIYPPTFDEIRENLAQGLSEIMSPKAVLIIRLRRPGEGGREEVFFSFASFLPSNPLLQVLGCWLFDRKPPVREMFCFIPDKAQPVFFLSSGNAVRFCEDTCKRSTRRSYMRSEFTNQSSVVHLDRIVLPCDGHPGSRSRLRRGLTIKTLITCHRIYFRKLQSGGSNNLVSKCTL